MTEISLLERYPRAFEIPILILGSVICLGSGLVLPTVTLRELIFWKHTFSILSGIQNLYLEKYYFLAIVIFIFSIVFPLGKLATLAIIWYKRISEEKRHQYIHWLGVLGKWSMLDVFVVAVTIVLTKASGLIEAEPHIGIYIFALAILFSMIATMRIDALNKRLNSET